MAERTIKVTPEELRSAAQTIEGLANDYRDAYEEMYRNTDAMENEWKGKDNLAYIDQINGFKDDFKKMFDLMKAYVKFLNDSAKAYDDTQDNVEKIARRLQN